MPAFEARPPSTPPRRGRPPTSPPAAPAGSASPCEVGNLGRLGDLLKQFGDLVTGSGRRLESVALAPRARPSVWAVDSDA